MALPKNYEVPTADSGYMRWEQDENKFRILSDVIVGSEAWNEVEDEKGKRVRKPLRFRPEAQIPVAEIDEPDKIKHFWAMAVWNYNLKRVQVLEITQRTIQKNLAKLERSKEWGDLKNFDVQVFRTGEGLDTEYEVVPIPPKPLAKEIKEAYGAMTINLEALYDGDDPFEEITEADLEEVE